MSVQVECSDKDLHSGVYGGSVHEAMTDLITLMGKHGFRSLPGDLRGKPEWPCFRLSAAFGAVPVLRGLRLSLSLLLLPPVHCSL